jgi:hypothetical protein
MRLRRLDHVHEGHTGMSQPASPRAEALEDAVRQALKQWHASDAAGSPFQYLQLFQQVQQERSAGVR